MRPLSWPCLYCLVAAVVGLTALASWDGPADAQEPSEAVRVAEDPAHEELRQLRRELEAVVAASDWEKIRPLVSAGIIVTWLDGTQSRGVDAVIAYLESKTGGESPLVEKFGLHTEVAELADLYGDDFAIAYGAARSTFVMRGVEVSFDGPWDATLVREEDDWKLATLSASVGAFDNPLLTWYRRLIWMVGILAAMGGLVLGYLLAWRRRASRATAVDIPASRLAEDQV